MHRINSVSLAHCVKTTQSARKYLLEVLFSFSLVFQAVLTLFGALYGEGHLWYLIGYCMGVSVMCTETSYIIP